MLVRQFFWCFTGRHPLHSLVLHIFGEPIVLCLSALISEMLLHTCCLLLSPFLWSLLSMYSKQFFPRMLQVKARVWVNFRAISSRRCHFLCPDAWFQCFAEEALEHGHPRATLLHRFMHFINEQLPVVFHEWFIILSEWTRFLWVHILPLTVFITLLPNTVFFKE